MINKAFFKLQLFAVVGASNERSKFGNKVLRAFQGKSLHVIPISKKQDSIEGIACMDSLASLARKVTDDVDFQQAVGVTSTSDIGVSIVTPPGATRSVLEEGLKLGYKHFFLQPGTYDEIVEEFMAQAKKTNYELNFIQSCVLREFDIDPHS